MAGYYQWTQSNISYKRTSSTKSSPLVFYQYGTIYRHSSLPSINQSTGKFSSSGATVIANTYDGYQGTAYPNYYYSFNLETAFKLPSIATIYGQPNGNTDFQWSGTDRATIYRISKTSGSFVSYVYSPNISAYPNGGASGNYYYSDRVEVDYPILTVPSIAMQGQNITINWTSGNSIFTSYTLQRKANTDTDWVQVYSGPNLTFTEQVGTWTSVQYQIAATANGVIGNYEQSPSIPVIAASTLAISGTDSDLGTITSDIPYTVSSDTGNNISLIRTVNGAQVANLTVQSGFAYNISIADLPTGTGTIVITASVQATSGTVTVSRTWTYYKAPMSYPASAGMAQLAQNGQNIWPLTIPDAVKVPPYLGGDLGQALNKLSQAILYNKNQVAKYSEVNINLANVSVGDEVLLPENGVMVPFYVSSLNYEPTLNTSGNRVLLVRKDIYDERQWNSSDVNAWASSTMLSWLNNTYKAMLDSNIQSLMGTTTYYYTPGNGNTTVTTRSDAVFLLSVTEFGWTTGGVNTEGSPLPNASTLRIAYKDGIATIQWTRSPYTGNSTNALRLNSNASTGNSNCTKIYGSRPAFTLPTTFTATYYVDSDNNVYPSQEYTLAGSYEDVFGNTVPMTKIETGSYVGTGTQGSSNPNSITCSFPPKVVIVSPQYQLSPYTYGGTLVLQGQTYGTIAQNGGDAGIYIGVGVCTFSGNSVSWYSRTGLRVISGSSPASENTSSDLQFNKNGVTYNYIAFG